MTAGSLACPDRNRDKQGLGAEVVEFVIIETNFDYLLLFVFIQKSATIMLADR